MPKRHRKNIRKRHRKKRNWFAPFGILFVLGSLFYIPRLTERFAALPMSTIKDIRVTGASALSMVDLQKISGLGKGVKLSAKKEKEAVKKLKSNPRLSKVAIMKDMTGQVQIHVSEITPSAMIQIQRQFYYVGQDGKILDEADLAAGKNPSLTVITGNWEYERAKEKAIEAIEIKKQLQEGGVRESDISELHFDGKIGWVLYHVGVTAPIVFGIEQIDLKSRRLISLLQHFKSEKKMIREIDLDFEKKAIVKWDENE